ncbi:hypothetical protein BASA81_012059 [Batrachochytrium salamandrivorans]|nr:hypothetical protein BASA81_012059 [Batrachochytrium salamandrivorans]
MIIRSLLANELKDTKSVMYELRGNSGGSIKFANSLGHDAGTIFGEDERTGGGGAIFKKLDPFLIRASPTYFKKFPFNQELTSGSITYANTLTVGVTQFVRTGRYKGQGIEDVGIKTDTVFRPRWSDLQPDSTTNTQYDRIANTLLVLVRRTVRASYILFVSHFRSRNPLVDSHWKLRPLVFTSSLFQADGNDCCR